MIPTNNQFVDAHILCQAIELFGFKATVGLRSNMHCTAIKYASIIISNANKTYHFSDPDWDVINKQLMTLLENITVTSKVIKSS